VGAGDGGGTGGGPYRPGSGNEPPGLLREVAPDYTDPARRAGLKGEVLLKMVVTAEGTVTDVRVLQRPGSGLDERASAASSNGNSHRRGATECPPPCLSRWP